MIGALTIRVVQQPSQRDLARGVPQVAAETFPGFELLAAWPRCGRSYWGSLRRPVSAFSQRAAQHDRRPSGLQGIKPKAIVAASRDHFQLNGAVV